ncbi:MAG: hypothetical protein P3B98_13075, partial [Gemmatimonadota bacterium]|nr:hypothetical protein [Gemmatimonadota bacterium]
MLPAPHGVRRLLVLCAVLAAAIISSCGREITAPLGGVVRFARGLSLVGNFPPAYQVAGGANLVPFSRVRIVLLHADGRVALDTTVDFPANAETLTLSLTVPLSPGAPATGEPMAATLGYINAQGDTVFKGSVPVVVTPSAPGAPPPAPVQVPVQYTGTGSDAGSVVVATRSVGGLAGGSVTVSAQVLSKTGQVLSGTPLVFSSSRPSVAAVNNPTVGTVTLVARGQAWVRAQTLTGQADSALVTVTLPASQLTLVSGNTQTASVGGTLTQPIVAKVAANDGIGVAGVSVTFAAGNDGRVSPASAVSDANGLVSTTWTLGTAPGTQGLTIAAPSLSGATVPVSATARTLPATRFEFVAQPSSATAGTSVGTVRVQALDTYGNIDREFNGDVTAELLGGAAGAVLAGTSTVFASSGVATFTGLSVNRAGSGYALRFSAPGLTPIVSVTFSIAAGPANRLLFTTQPSGSTAGGVITPAVALLAQDAFGNTASSFSGTVTMTLAGGAAGAALGGTRTRAASSGVVQFGDLVVSKAGTGYTLTASAEGVSGATSDAFAVLAGSATRLAVEPLPTSVGAGTAIAPPITVTAQDAQGNVVPSFTGTVTVALNAAAGGGTLSGTRTRTAVAGVARFDDLSVDLLGTGYTLTFSAPSVTSVTSTPFAIVAGPARQLVVGMSEPTLTAGVRLSPALTVTARDAQGNTASSFSSSVTITLGANPAAGTLAGTTTRNATNGVATFDDLTVSRVGSGYTFVASATGIPTASSAPFQVVAGSAAKLNAIVGDEQRAAGGAALTPITFQLTDAPGNPIAGTSVAFAVATGGGTVTPTTATTDASGAAVVNWTLGPSAGAQSIRATAAGITGTANATATSTVTNRLVLTTNPGNVSVTAGATLPAFVVSAYDAGNTQLPSLTFSASVNVASGPAGAIMTGTTAAGGTGSVTFNSLQLL